MPLPSRVSDLTGFDLLLSVARTGSIGRAAAEHGISQPAASARMRLLEGQLGLALIERSPRGSRLTPAGALVAGWAQAAVDAAAALDAGLVALRRERDSRLRIAASMTVAEYLLPVWLTALRAVDPGAVVALSAVNSAEVAQAVLADAADIGFIEGPGIPDGLHAEPVGRDTLTLVVAPAHPWARRRSGVPAGELARTPLVSREAGSGTRRFLEEALRAQAGLERVPPAAELSSTTAIKAAVAAGGRPGGAQFAGRRGGAVRRNAARGPGHRRGPDPHAPRGVDRGPPPHRPGPGPLRDRGQVRPPRPALTRAHSRANHEAGAWSGGAVGQLAWAAHRRRAIGVRAGPNDMLSAGLIVTPGGTISSIWSRISSLSVTSAASSWDSRCSIVRGPMIAAVTAGC